MPLLLVFVASVALVYQTPATYSIDVGSRQDEAYTLNFHARSDTVPSYRWSDVYGYIVLPGAGGSRPFTATLTIDPGRTAPVEVFINGEQFFSSPLDAGWHTLEFRVDTSHPQALQSRDTVIELRSTDYRTEENPAEPKGMKVDTLAIRQDANGPFIVPALAPLAWMCLALVLTYLLVHRIAVTFASQGRARLYGLIASALLASGSLFVLTESRIFVGAAAGHVATTLFSALLISIAVEILLRWRHVSLSPVQCRVLACVIGLAFLLRYGGMSLPQSVIVDMPWHMKWLRTLLAGDWQSLYFPGGLSSVPREWGMELLIPKSPLFYFAFSPLGIIPFELATSTKWLICLLDAVVGFCAYILARRANVAPRAAILAASLYAIMPLAFRAFAYGILPTIFAQWLAALLFLLVLWLASRYAHLAFWLLLGLVATLTLLSFPTVALFVSLVLAGYVAWLCLRPGLRRVTSRAYIVGVPATLAVAWLVAVVAYYGLYISPVIASAGALLTPTAGQASTVRWPGGFVELLAWTSDYAVTTLPILLAVFGFALLIRKGSSAMSSRALALLLAWASIAPIFVLVNYRVDMIGKHLFFTMAPIAVAGGLALYYLGMRGRWGVLLASLALTLIAWQGLVFWIERLVRASS